MKSMKLLFGVMPLLGLFGSVFGNQLALERPYEPVELRGDKLAGFYGYPVNEIFLYAWNDTTKSWRMMPFQIDERVYAVDPYDEEHMRHSYFLPDDGLLDVDDELVFMVADMGDRAPDMGWIDNPESKAFQRIELRAVDRENAALAAYAYLFRSATITESVPMPYGLGEDSLLDQIESKFYTVSLDDTVGLVENISIKPPFGSGVDIFDRQKIRAKAVLGAGPFGDLRFNKVDERWIKLLPGYRKVTSKPVVRLIREVRQTFALGIPLLEEKMAFYITARFYPFNGRVTGGSALDSESLRRAMPAWEDPYINFIALRQSWDLNVHASGMLFYNNRNRAIPIDGQSDLVDAQIDRPVYEWTMVTGSQGTLFSMTVLPDTVADAISLYYYDNSQGGTGDAAAYKFEDTGDFASYGDFGLTMYNAKSLELKFEMYFLPSSVSTAEQAVKIAHSVGVPVDIQPSVTHVADRSIAAAPQSFVLAQNYPNPFNPETTISFVLHRPMAITLQIFDAHGRRVRRLASGFYAAGGYQTRWDGCNENGLAVASGVYFYQLTGESQTSRNKLLLMR